MSFVYSKWQLAITVLYFLIWTVFPVFVKGLMKCILQVFSVYVLYCRHFGGYQIKLVDRRITIMDHSFWRVLITIMDHSIWRVLITIMDHSILITIMDHSIWRVLITIMDHSIWRVLITIMDHSIWRVLITIMDHSIWRVLITIMDHSIWRVLITIMDHSIWRVLSPKNGLRTCSCHCIVWKNFTSLFNHVSVYKHFWFYLRSRLDII